MTLWLNMISNKTYGLKIAWCYVTNNVISKDQINAWVSTDVLETKNTIRHHDTGPKALQMKRSCCSQEQHDQNDPKAKTDHRKYLKL